MDAAALEVMSGLLARAVAGDVAVVLSPALAAHREALVERLVEVLESDDGWWDAYNDDRHPSERTLAFARRLADAVLADPAHRLTVETGLREQVEALRDRLRWEAQFERDQDGGDDYAPQDAAHAEGARLLDAVADDVDSILAHGLVRDEPSEDEHTCRYGNRACIACLPADEPSKDERACTCDKFKREGHCAAVPARSDDGRTAVELTDEEIGDLIYAGGSEADYDAVIDVVRRLLAARLRHDDGEADRGGQRIPTTPRDYR